MNLPQLYYSRRLVEAQHYTEVTEVLYITQPSSGGSIVSLKKEPGVSPFQKKKRNIQLTKYEKEFYQYISESLDILEHGASLIKGKSGHASGSTDIGCIPALLSDFPPEALKLYHEENPLATINIYHEMSIEVTQGVSSGKYNIGFCSMADDMLDLVFIPIAYQKLVAIVQNSHPLADHGAIYLLDLNGYRLITYQDIIPTGKVVYKLLKKEGVEAVYSYNNETSIAGGISSFSKAAIAADTPLLRQFGNPSKVRPPDAPEDIRMIYTVYSSKNFITSAVEAFANFMVAHYLNMLGWDSFTFATQLSHKTQKRNRPLLSEPEERLLFPYPQLSKM